MTILHLTHEGRAAGSSISIALLARAQRTAGHRVVVACPGGSFLARRAAAAGVDVVPCEFGAGRARAVAALAARLGAEVVNAHASRDRAACRRARLSRRLPAALVMTRRAMPRSSLLSVLADGFLADAVIAVSRPVAAALVRRGMPRRKVTVVPNAVDLERLDRPVSPAETARARAMAQGAHPAVADGRPLVGVVARRKDQATLLRALPLVSRPVALVCLGIDGDAELTALAQQAAPHAVAFVPFQEDPRPFYELFDVCVLPTGEEGMPQGLLEAMALGKPVVASAAGGVTDLVRAGTDGLLVPPHEPRPLAAALDRLLADATLARRLGVAARARVRDHFTIAQTAARTEDVYRAACARRSRA